MIIGITTTYVEEEQKDEIVPVERVTVEYVRRVAAAGAVPVLLPPVEGGADANRRAARELVERLDGLVLAGGGDLNPATYGDEARLAETVNVFDGRDALELELARLAHERDLPTLGICRGMQVLNVALGGALYQDVHACGLTDAAHQQKRRAPACRHRAGQRAGPGAVRRRGRGHGTRLQDGMARIARNELGGHRACAAFAAGEHDAPPGDRLRGRPAAGERGQRRRSGRGFGGPIAALLPRRAVAS